MNINIFRFIQVCIIAISAIYNFQIFEGTKLYGNAASRILLAVGPKLGIGSPYRDFYEIVPPGYLQFIATWVRLFGMSMFSFRSIQVLLVILNGFFLLLICEKLFKHQELRLFVFFSIIITVHSRIIQTDFFSIDFFATTMVLGGLSALFYIKNTTVKLAIAATLFTYASQIKDIYLLSLATLAPIYIREFLRRTYKDFIAMISVSAIGPLTIFILMVGYLISNGVFIDYLYILKDKYGFAQGFMPGKIGLFYFHMFSFSEQMFLKVKNLTLILLSINTFRLILNRHQLKNYVKKNHPLKIVITVLDEYTTTHSGNIVATITLFAALLYGVGIYGLYSGTQLTPIVTAFFTVLGLLLIWPITIIHKRIKPGYIKIVAIFLILVLFFPKESIFRYKYYKVRRTYPFAIEKEIQQKTKATDCILHVHGWEVAASYIHSQRRPCSKYFLTNELFNIGARRPEIYEEYRTELFTYPPAAIIYSEKGADTDFDRFESQVLALRKILNYCYTKDPRYIDYKDHFFAAVTLYWPNADLQKEELQSCWRKYAQ